MPTIRICNDIVIQLVKVLYVMFRLLVRCVFSHLHQTNNLAAPVHKAKVQVACGMFAHAVKKIMKLYWMIHTTKV